MTTQTIQPAGTSQARGTTATPTGGSDGGAKSGGATGAVLAVGFGTAVAMWGMGYLARVFTASVPAPVLLAALVLCLVLGGYVLGRWASNHRDPNADYSPQRTQRSQSQIDLKPEAWSLKPAYLWRGALVGMVAALIDLLVFGGILAGQTDSARAAALWVPGFVLACALLTSLGAAIGHFAHAPAPQRQANWTGAFAIVAVVATFILVIAGGLVTGFRAGLSVPDWPTSYSYNMFLYPLSKMNGGIYYEHAHRLYGSLVGLTTLVLAVHIWLVDRRRWLRLLLLAALLAVIAQGTVGGLRVTQAAVLGKQHSAPGDESVSSLTLAIAHGVFGQMILGLMAAIAAFTSRTWRLVVTVKSPTARLDRTFAAMAVALLLVQLTLGAIQRQTQHVLLLHITFATITAAGVLAPCIRSWGLYGREQSVICRLALWGMGLLLLQIMLGVTAVTAVGSGSGRVTAVVSTIHQGVGAGLLVQGVLLATWTWRIVVPAPR